MGIKMARFSVYREGFAAAILPSFPAGTVSVPVTNEAGIASQSCLTENHVYYNHSY